MTLDLLLNTVFLGAHTGVDKAHVQRIVYELSKVRKLDIARGRS